MKTKKFTVVELLIVMAIIAIAGLVCIVGFYGILFCVVCKGNMYYTDSGVLAKIQVVQPDAQKIVDSERGVYNYSRVLVEDSKGDRQWYTVNTNVLFNYDVSPEPIAPAPPAPTGLRHGAPIPSPFDTGTTETVEWPEASFDPNTGELQALKSP